MNILIHGSIIGPGGIAHHIREFSKTLSKCHNVKIRNFNLDHKNWEGIYTGPDIFKNTEDLEDVHHKMLHQQSLWENDELKDFPLSGYDESFVPDIHLIMGEAYHYYYYQEYNKPTIAYFPWETTELLHGFIERLQKMDYLWVPSKWQLETFVNNGLDRDKISVVNEGVDPSKFFPVSDKNNEKLTILHIGTWEYRKSSYELIKAVTNVIGNDPSVEFKLAIHNKYREQESPQDSFTKYGLPINENITFLDTLYEDDYINEIRNADLYVSCSRGEGWNLPLIQSLSSGVPSIYSKSTGQLEYTENSIGIGVDIIGEEDAQRKLIVNNHEYFWELLHDYYPGKLSEPNYSQFEYEVMKFYISYKLNKLSEYRDKALLDSQFIQKNFNWDYITECANNILKSYNLEKKQNTMSNIYYLIHSHSFGDTLAATPTLRYISQSHNKKVNVVSKQNHIFNNNPYVSRVFSFEEFYNLDLDDIIKYESFTFAGRKDNNGIEKKFSHIDTRQLHAMDLGFQLMPHQMEYDYTPNHVELGYDIPERYVVCHITQNWANRTWDTMNWQKVIDWLSENKIFTILIGKDHSEIVHESISVEPIIKACPKLENLYGLDLCNKIGLEEMYQVIKNGKVLITMDTGPLHIAGATDTHILQIGSAQHPLLRIPYRKNTQNYKYDFVGGTCSLFCNTDLKYNVREWGHVNAVAPLTECSENKPTFECHPPVDKVINKLKDILHLNNDERYLEFFELIEDNNEDKILFNFTKTTDDTVKIIVKDVSTGLTRDKYETKCKRHEVGYYWWAPMPGKVLDLGPIDLLFYLNDEYYGKKRLNYDGGKKLLFNDEEYYMDYLKGNEYPTFWEVFINGDYEKESTCVVENGDVVLDIGANYGFFTMNSIMKGALKVYSVEPYEPAFKHIQKLSDDIGHIQPINKAISETDGVISMFINEDASATNCVTKHGELFGRNSNETIVESVNINTLISSIPEKINFMKIDCEGSEFELFKTISDSNLKSIKKIVVETHGDEIDGFVYRKLTNNDFIVYRYDNILFAVNLY